MKILLTLFVLLFSSSVVAEKYNCTYTFDNKVENFIIERQDNYFLRIDYEETYKIGDVVYEDENLINLYSSPDNFTDDTAYLFIIDKKQKGFTMVGLEYKNSTDIIEGVCN